MIEFLLGFSIGLCICVCTAESECQALRKIDKRLDQAISRIMEEREHGQQ